MSAPRRPAESFDCAPGLQLAAHERLSELQFATLGQRLDRIEALIARLERRLWLAVYGVVAAILVQGAAGLLSVVP
ncbi:MULTISPECIES: GTA head formation protein, RCAP_rcc01685 family [unclassified Roseivivax]|uniref:GTA head formation protein, RCAP_rcc01685 family n=1 Tax=Roseivivax sp. GX 12232 TaxID=2900547 RepID=UPI001E61790D|nr:hypothetical protein [Roseivivax sp. GX 12232]MCE0504373.1 hypothetical protein [Roseivivax sp. GX 12232]